MTHRLVVRGFVGPGLGLRFEERVTVKDADLENVVPELAERHAGILLGEGGGEEPYMIEIEFVDFPVEERFFRFGNTEDGLVDPMRVL